MVSYSLNQPMRIQARPGSKAEAHYGQASLPGEKWAMPKAIANGVSPDPLEDLIFHGGKVVPQMEFQNVYLGKQAQWATGDINNIDEAILRAMRHAGLNSVLKQYFKDGSLSCDQRASTFADDAKVADLDEPDVQRIVTSLYDTSAVSQSNTESCIFNLILPSGSLLRLGDSNSAEGLGGYHGSVHLQRGGKRVTLYYSANVFSQKLPDGRENGITVFNAPWKNVVATLYHELNEFRTDADVNDAIEKNDNDFLGWSSRSGREIGDQPIFQAGGLGNLKLVFKELSASPGKKLPVQLLYSNRVHGAEGP